MMLRKILATATACALVLSAAPAVAQSYHTHAEIGQELLDAQTNYPGLAQRWNLGYSVQGRELWALNISDNVGTEEDEPEFKYISSMHGDEIVGVELCLLLIDELLTNYGSDSQITNLVDEVDIWILPLMNPDGYETPGRSRYNAHGVDLNRNFPEWTDGDPNTITGHEPETQVVMLWSFANSFTLSANYHCGTLVANYPYDDDDMGSTYSPTPDDDMFIWISEEYTQYNLPMWNSPSFYHGITNGADWYLVSGGMQDWSYRYMGCNEITIEVSNTDQPPYSQIPTFWSQNRDSMLAYMDTCLIGVRGLVTDALTGAPVDATVSVSGRAHDIFTDPDVGDYHRMLLPGTYDLTVTPNGEGRPVDLQNVLVTSGPATRQDVLIWTGCQVTYPNGGEVLPVDTEVTVSWLGDPAAQFQVQQRADAEPLMSDDFESSGLGPQYTTGGDEDWLVTTADAFNGSQSARAGDIGDVPPSGQETWMTRTVDGPGVLSFWYRVSSEPNYDTFTFYIDDIQQHEDSGEKDGWEYYSTTLAAGSYELKWEYSKDYSISKGDDTVYIDELRILPAGSAWEDIIALTAVGATSTPWTPTEPAPAYKVRVRPYYSESGYGNWDESDAVFEVQGVVVADGDYDDDGDVDLEDHSAFMACFGSAASGDCADAFEFDVDGVIDLDDYDDLAALLSGP